MIIGITAFYVFAIYLLKELGNFEKFLTLMIINEPVILGFIFIGLAIILEKDQGVFSAIFTTPINIHVYLIAKALTLASLSLVCAFGMTLITGKSFNIVHFMVGVFSCCILFSFIGVYIVSHTTEILHFMLYSIPLLVLMSLPLLNYFEITEISLLKLFPLQGGLNLISNSFSNSPNLWEIIFGYISLAVWIPSIYWISYRTFKLRLIDI